MGIRTVALALAASGLLGCRAGEAPAAQGHRTGYDLAAPPAWRATLPDELSEISGLAVTTDGRLFAHGDERGTLFQVEPRTGQVVKRFTLAPTGEEPDLGKKSRDGEVAGDFEGLAIVDDRFFLVTSNGVLVEFAEGADGAQVPYTAHPTPLAEVCEVEGLTHDPATDALLLLCKEMRRKSERDRVAAYTWSLRDRRLEPTPRLAVPYAQLAPATRSREFNGSALTFTPGGRSLILVAGPQQLYAQVTAEGRPLAGGTLDRQAQPQPEGAAVLPDGTLLIASEGGKDEGMIAGYPAAR